MRLSSSSASAMAEPLLPHTDDHAHLSTPAVFLDGFLLPLAHSAQNPAALDDASNGDPTTKSAEDNADSAAPQLGSCRLLLLKEPPNFLNFQESSAFLEDPNARSGRFPHSPAISAYPSAQLEADFAGVSSSDLDALSVDTQTHLKTVREDFPYLQQLQSEPSVACVPSSEDSVHALHKEVANSTKPNGHHEACTRTHVKSNDPHALSGVLCAGSEHAGANFLDPHVQLTLMSLQSSEESTGLHEEGGDSTEPQGSNEDSTHLHAGYEDPCDDSEDFTCIEESGCVAANACEVIQDFPEELVDPHSQQPDGNFLGNGQPCFSECSSVMSVLTNAMPEVTSRLDNSYMSEDGIESHWTDAKHGSYLDYMETCFVKNLYGKKYCALDVCGQQPFHQVSESLPSLPATLFEFKSWQSGDWHRRSMLKPPLLTSVPLALLESPWVNHFRHHKFSHAKQQIEMENASSSCSIDGEEEVNSRSTELHGGAFRHLCASRQKTGHKEKLVSENGISGREAVGLLKQDGLQGFASDTETARLSKMRKRGFQTDTEQEPSRRCKRDDSF